MNTQRTKFEIILSVGMMIAASIILLAAGQQIVTAAPQSIIANAGADITDYPIGEDVTLDGSNSSGPPGSTLYYTWEIFSWPQDDPDHHAGGAGDIICLRSMDPQCGILALSFFDADDVGEWTILLTVDDGEGNSATDVLAITIKGFNDDDRWPTRAETNTVNSIVSWIDWNTPDFYGLLHYTNIPNVIYAVGTGEIGDGQHPDYEHEDRYMQTSLIPILERLIEYAQVDGLRVIVTEAWDPPAEPNWHGNGSRHLEGRALDIVPNYNSEYSQEETTKRIGRLAHLAQEVVQELGYGPNDINCPRTNGCVWIYHEHNHLHLSVRGQTAAPYDWGYKCDNPDTCLPHVYNPLGEYSGAAVGAMIVNWQGWTSIDEGEFYYHSGVQGWGNLTCEVMANTLNKYIDRGWTCVRTQTREEAVRIAAFWMEHTLDQGIFLGANPFHAFPIAIPMEGDYEHWVAVQGYIATEDPNSQGQGSVINPGGGTYTVGALQVVDPQVNSSDPSEREYAKRFVTKYELEGNLELDSITIPNLGVSYTPTGPNNTFELVVPAGCEWTGYLNPVNVLAASSINAFGNSVGQICDSRFSIVNPPTGSTVSTTLPVRVIALGPPNAIDAYLTVKEDTPSGIPFEYPGNRLSTVTDFTGTVWEFDMWQPGFLSDFRLSLSANLGAGIQQCGTTLVTASSSPDSTYPQVSFLQPLDQEHIEVKQEYRIQVRALDNQGIQKNSYSNDLVKVRIIHRGSGVTDELTIYELCGPNCYEFRWLLGPQSPDGEYELTAIATDVAGLEGYSNVLKVPVGQGDPVTIDQINLTNGQIIQNRHEIKIIANGGLGRLIADLKITGPEPIERKGILIDKGIEEFLLNWIPRTNGAYTVRVTVYDQLKPSNQAMVTRNVEVRRNDVIWDGEWKRLRPATSPGVKNAAMVDTGDGIYLFGGQRISGGGFNNKLWKWDGSNWIDQTPPSPSTWPEARTYPQLTYDSMRGRLVLFGGLKQDGTILRDVWEYMISTKTWVERTKYPIPHFTKWPSPTYLKEWAIAKGATRMTYDALHERSLLLNSYSFLWDSMIGDWIPIDTWDSDFATVAYDSGRDVVVLYTQGSHLEIDEWDGSQWQEIPIAEGGLKPHPKQSKFIGSPFGVYLIGGEGNTKELWLWDGAVWTRVHSSQGTPPKTNYYSASVAYDSARNQLVVHTTNGQTWVYSSKLENLSATPKLYDDVWPPDSSYKLGPGMQLTFRPYPHPNVAAYETQVSEDGGSTWQACTMCGYSLNGSVQHHGDFIPAGCGHGYYYCLKREQSYSYRIRPLNQADQPMLDWTYVFNVTSFDWPAHVEIKTQTPGPYQNGETVTLNLKNSYGQGMKVDWIINAWGGATATVESGCGTGNYYKHLISQTCTLTISYQTALEMQGTTKLAKLEPPTSVDVIVKGTDIWNNTSFSDTITLNFESGDEPPRFTKVEPMLYPAEYQPGKKYGPGMRLEWIHSPHPEMAFYEIQFSEDGGTTWQVYKHARDDQWDWVNHHGNLHCEHGFYRCLKRNQVYHYRIRALDSAESPITDWSDVISATSMEWPAHVEIAATPPGLQYPSNTVVTLDLVDTYGPNLQIEWEIFAHGQAEFTILDNTCQNGSFLGHAKVQKCKLRIRVNPNTSGNNDVGSTKLAAPLMALNSVRVVVIGTDSLGYHFSDQVDLTFKKGDDDTIKESSIDAPRAQWTDM